MHKLSLDVDQQHVEGVCPLSVTLKEFLFDNGVDTVSELYQTGDGKLVSSHFELAHRWAGVSLTSQKLSQEYPALVPEQLLSGVTH